MATWTFSPTDRNLIADTSDFAFDLAVYIVDDLPMVVNTSATVQYEGILSIGGPSANYILTLNGQGLTSFDGKVTGGTINQITLTIAGKPYVTITGLSVSGEAFGNLATIDNDNLLLLEQLLLAGNDRMTGTKLDDDMNGMAGNDRMMGGSGGDNLYGGTGNDTLFGGMGADDLLGGAGADRFVFDKNVRAAGVDFIDDFSRADTLVLDNDAFKGIGGPGKLAASKFKNIDTGNPDGNDRFYYSQQSGGLWYDPDGSGFKAWVLFASLQDGARLTAGDFLIIG